MVAVKQNPKARRIFQVELSDGSRLAILALSQSAAENIVIKQAKRENWKSFPNKEPITVIRENEQKENPNRSANDIALRHQIKIAKADLRLPKGMDIMRVFTNADARDILRKGGWSEKRIEDWETYGGEMKRENGKTERIRYVLMIDGNSFGEWRVKARYGAKGYGQPNDKNLETVVYSYLKSFNDPKGANHHIVKQRGTLEHFSSAYIKDQQTGEIVARWKAPAFMVLDTGPDTKYLNPKMAKENPANGHTSDFFTLAKYLQQYARKHNIPVVAVAVPDGIRYETPNGSWYYTTEKLPFETQKEFNAKATADFQRTFGPLGHRKDNIKLPNGAGTQNPMNEFTLVMYKQGDSFPNVKIITRSNDYDKLTDKAQRLQESEYNLDRIYQVVRTQDLIDAKKHNPANPKKAILDKADSKHLTAWIERHYSRSDWRTVKANILKFLAHSPDYDYGNQGWTSTVRAAESVLGAITEKKHNPANPANPRNDGAADFKNFQKQRLTELAKMFQGHTTGEIKKVIGPNSAPRGSYPLGYLAQMTVKYNGKKEKIDFDGDAYLTGDLRNNLWVKGKGAIIDGIARPKNNGLVYLGKLIQIDYVTAKKHIEGGKTVRFWHPLGEVDREYPELYMDADGFPIIIGGGYDVWEVGIVN